MYDGSAKYMGASINDAMLQGPDLNSSLRGVLLRFREQPIAFVSDVEKMFNSFSLPKEQRDSYRFFWFKGNDPEQDIVQYRSTCHLFGSRASPAIACFGLKYTASHEIANKYPQTVSFLREGFYVDDGIYSAPSVEQAVEIIAGARAVLGLSLIHI